MAYTNADVLRATEIALQKHNVFNIGTVEGGDSIKYAAINIVLTAAFPTVFYGTVVV